MKRSSVSHMNCSVARSLDIVGEWWTLLIVRNIMFGQRRFEAIQADLGIARNILSDRLNTLVAHEVVERVKYQEHPERYEYHLTEKGRDLYPVVAALMAWGDKWESPDGPPLVMRHTCGEQVAARMVCAACGEPIEFGAVRSKAGPGFRPTVVPPGK
ncbi:MAG TPA: helix-turn-helix domain-containing protein [Ilumatobacteraceae bacterium]|nr:helix-turn-helix domain-containing protein [Ilumatobacteraceae bacterium]